MKRYVIKQGDAFELLAALKSASVDCVITDPPYESLEKHRKQGGTTGRLKISEMSSNEWFNIVGNEKLPLLLAELYRVLKPNSHCYIFCDGETSDVFRQCVSMMPKARAFRWWKRIVWDKMAIGLGYHYRCRHEFVIFLEKGKRKLNNLGVPDIIAMKRVANGYPTEKPSALNQVFIENSTDPGQIVLDPFCGSGSAGTAALSTGRRFIGFDLSEKAIALSRARLEVLNGAA